MTSMTIRFAYSAEQVAEAFAISLAAAYRLMRSGELETVYIGGCRRVPADALEEYLQRRRDEARGGGHDELPPAA